ncbi:unnamed protein product [Parnassius apollo]|uniref:(apollo) hypothetical protein n=1 Tax=Parnassius apollo TaxID=110799 RepID=A0A8S3WSW5_PARAO|nr:unnamed protein product [Parnassius apollo]
MAKHINDSFSDEEIFFGNLSLKEIKKHVTMGRYRYNAIDNNTNKDERHVDSSLKIIKTRSEPDPNPGVSLNVSDPNSSLSSEENGFSSWSINSINDSFLEMEKMVSELQKLPNSDKEKLDNTLEVVKYILNNHPIHEEGCKPPNKTEDSKDNDNEKTALEVKVIDTEPINVPVSIKDVVKLEEVKYSLNTELFTPIKKKGGVSDCNSGPSLGTFSMKTIDNPIKTDNITTPFCGDTKQVALVFKTPKSHISQKKQFLTTKMTPSKLNSYQHIISPVAAYIKSSPQVPLLKVVRPRKPLPGISSIPKLLKTTEKTSDKENINLPSVAYKSAQRMKVIKVPNEEKLPGNQWAKKLSPSLSKPIVIKHDHRENNVSKTIKEPNSEDSFSNLTLHQAEVSICTQKSAFSTLKKRHM